MATSPELRNLGPLFAGRYELRKKLGTGSLGTVYLASDERARRLVALKILRRDHSGSPGPSVLQQEFEAFAALDHPRLARAFDFGYADTQRIPYYTREYVQGVPLAAGPPLDVRPQEFLRPILHLLEALEYLHSNGILHLDVHAGNLIVADDARRGSVLIDFGIVRSVAPHLRSSWLERGGGVPNELRAPGVPTAATDIYMAGRLLLYRLTGRADGQTRPLLDVAGWGDRLNIGLERIIARALEPNPAHRFDSAAEFRRSIQDALGEARLPPAHPGPIDVFVGRERELSQVDAAFRKALEGKSSFQPVLGAPGAGKSRLLQEARRHAQVLGCDVVEVRFAEAGRPEPRLLDALRAAAGSDADSRRWLEPLRVDHGGTTQERAERAAKAFFAAPGRPIALLLDDIEHADAESAALLAALRSEIAAARSGPGGRAIAVITTSTGAAGEPKTLKLGPMSRAHARRLMTGLLRPLAAPRAWVDRCLATTGRWPYRIRRAAMSARSAWGPTGRIPRSAALPDAAAFGTAAGALPAELGDACTRRILLALAVLDRPAPAQEIAALVGEAASDCRSRLRALVASELAVPGRRAGEPAFAVAGKTLGEQVLSAEPPRARRRLHERAARLLACGGKHDPLRLAELAHHWIGAGREGPGVKLALESAGGLRELGQHEHALDLLHGAKSAASSLRIRADCAEAISAVIEETGDHAIALRALEPLLRDPVRLPRRRQVRLLRMLGVHHHRAGSRDLALHAFESCRSLASPARDQEDLILVESEIAELHTYRGAYAQATDACRRGLELLHRLRRETPFKSRMEVILRATLGHVALRRLDLAGACIELAAALRLLSRGRQPSVEAVVLNNLGIAERQLGRLRSARRRFRAAERILRRAGEGRSLIKIACNVAVIAAQEGDAAEAESELAKAAHLLRMFPGARLEFFTDYTRGIVAHTLGDEPAAVRWLEAALKAGKTLGDKHLVSFGEVILAEAHMLCGRHGRSRDLLRRALRSPQAEAAPLLRRMALSRLAALHGWLGDSKRALAIAAECRRLPAADLEIPEAWNLLYLGVARALAGDADAGRRDIAEAASRFRRVRLPAAEKLSQLALIALGGVPGSRPAMESALQRLASIPATAGNKTLAVLEPLVAAEARLAAGDVDGADAQVALASAAMVGLPYLELDWRIELVRGRIVLHRGDRANARRHAERALHLRDLLVELLPPGWREQFLRQPRFQALEELSQRAGRYPRVIRSTAKLGETGAFEGMLGASTAMVRVFQTIDRLRDQEVPVLIEGETGTGKEMAARALHGTSSRWNGPFIAVNCAALPEELFEAEIFGHEAAAFTGAETAQPGLVEAACGGTILLDDVDQLSLKSQAKLLHALSSKQLRRVGGLEPRPFDVRLLSSTSRRLAEEVRRGAFRADLYFRLRVAEIVLPPLRGRTRDIGLLARYFLDRHSQRMDRPAPRLEQGALELLEAHSWPGNVRELESTLLRIVLELSPGAPISAPDARRHLAPLASQEAAPLLSESWLRGRSFKDWKLAMERAYVQWLQKECAGDAARMMARLGVKRTQLYALLRKLGLGAAATLRRPPRQ